ncbi:MAG TPA: ABC transporter ATP-binding protein [Victivallales bacterium]|nr:ABC transporter ATP-binding protein [Victivallales bacterium]
MKQSTINNQQSTLLSVRDFSLSFKLRNGVCNAVNGISFDIAEGETLGIVGESGAGKSVTCYSLLGLLPKNSINSGEAVYKGKNLLNLSDRELNKIRGKDISIIFQDPMSSLNPFLKVGKQITEPLITHCKVNRKQAEKEAVKILQEVGIDNPEQRFHQYPHEFSGGMRQRIMIAMALITKPKLLIADEPTTALDVTIQAKILKLLKRLKVNHSMGVIFITHDLGVVAQICDKVCVLYAGKIMEKGSVNDIFYNSLHPYTIALKKSIPSLEEKQEILYSIPGLPPDLSKKIKGCPFAPRCEQVEDKCFEVEELRLKEIEKGHFSSCIRY